MLFAPADHFHVEDNAGLNPLVCDRSVSCDHDGDSSSLHVLQMTDKMTVIQKQQHKSKAKQSKTKRI